MDLASASRSRPESPSSAEDALALLVGWASPQDDGAAVRLPQSVGRAAARLGAELAELTADRAALTEALIACQDRLLAVEALAQVDVRTVGGAGTLDELLDQAMTLTGAFQMVLMDDGRVSAARGEVAVADQDVALVRRLVTSSPRSRVMTTPDGRVLVGTLDPEDGPRQVAFFREVERPFTTADLPLVEAIVSALGVRLALARMQRRELEQAVIEREHQLASLLAQSVIAREAPTSAGIDVFARTDPAALTGGDFYVFGNDDGVLFFAVGDVAGKGLPAAVLMTRAVAACRVAFLARRTATVVDIFAQIEDELFEHLDDAERFMTLTVGSLDGRTGEVALVNAGHSPVWLVREGEPRPVPSSVPPLGVVRGQVPDIFTAVLGPACFLVVGSDGLEDQQNPDGVRFGSRRLEEICRSIPTGPSAEFVRQVFDALERFAAGTPRSDDATLVFLTHTRRAP